ncbi:MAG: hypothetical protein LBR27_10130 [Bifidobacteriaceae bacterium]|nr:hypothetical protein [Bifidobacteriaceae bacterium]
MSIRSVPPSSQLQAAEAYYSCLVGQGVPVRLVDWYGGQAEVVWDGETWVGWSPQYSLDVMGDLVTPPEWATPLIEGQDPPIGFEPHLEIDGIDYSKGFATCVVDSAYERPTLQVDPDWELEHETKLAEVSNEWARCARENGFPQIADAAAPKIDNGATEPEVRIPLSMTVEQLRELLKVCKFFDAEQAKAEWEAEQRGELVEWALLPNLVVDSLGDTPRDQQLRDSAPESDLDRAVDLHNTLYEELNQFYAQFAE